MARPTAPRTIDYYTLLHLVGDMVGLIDALGAESAVMTDEAMFYHVLMFGRVHLLQRGVEQPFLFVPGEPAVYMEDANGVHSLGGEDTHASGPPEAL
jgi:hypothetical protein